MCGGTTHQIPHENRGDFRSVRERGFIQRFSFPVLGEDVLVTGAGPIGIMAAVCGANLPVRGTRSSRM